MSLSRKDAAVDAQDGDKTPPRENPLPKPKMVPFVKETKEVKQDLASKPMKSQNDFRAMLFKK